jgi:hypothetical protein
MRSKPFGLLLGCAIGAATFAPALACSYHLTTVDNDQSPPQVAQAGAPVLPPVDTPTDKPTPAPDSSLSN